MPIALVMRCEASPEPREGHVRVALPLPFDADTVGSFLRRGGACACGARIVVDGGVETPARITPENATESTLRVAIRAANAGRALVEWLCLLLVSGAADEARKVALGLGDAMTHPDLSPPVEPVAEGEPGGGAADWWFAMMAHYGRAVLRQSGAEHFVMTVDDENTPDPMEVIVRWRRGKTPLALVRSLKSQIDMLRRGVWQEPPRGPLASHKYACPVYAPRPFTEAAVACEPAAVEAFADAVHATSEVDERVRDAAERVPGVAGARSYHDHRGRVWGLAGESRTALGSPVFVICDERGDAVEGDDGREILHLPGGLAAVIGRGCTLYLVTDSLRSDDLVRDAFARMCVEDKGG